MIDDLQSNFMSSKFHLTIPRTSNMLSLAQPDMRDIITITQYQLDLPG